MPAPRACALPATSELQRDDRLEPLEVVFEAALSPRPCNHVCPCHGAAGVDRAAAADGAGCERTVCGAGDGCCDCEECPGSARDGDEGCDQLHVRGAYDEDACVGDDQVGLSLVCAHIATGGWGLDVPSTGAVLANAPLAVPAASE